MFDLKNGLFNFIRKKEKGKSSFNSTKRDFNLDVCNLKKGKRKKERKYIYPILLKNNNNNFSLYIKAIQFDFSIWFFFLKVTLFTT